MICSSNVFFIKKFGSESGCGSEIKVKAGSEYGYGSEKK
jgi:hypothetical protein